MDFWSSPYDHRRSHDRSRGRSLDHHLLGRSIARSLERSVDRSIARSIAWTECRLKKSILSSNKNWPVMAYEVNLLNKFSESTELGNRFSISRRVLNFCSQKRKLFHFTRFLWIWDGLGAAGLSMPDLGGKPWKPFFTIEISFLGRFFVLFMI